MRRNRTDVTEPQREKDIRKQLARNCRQGCFHQTIRVISVSYPDVTRWQCGYNRTGRSFPARAWHAVSWIKTPYVIQTKRYQLFPASGNRNNNSGTTLNNVTTNGYCWSSSANSGNNGHNLNLNESAMYWNNNNRANGFPVRPVVAIAALCA